MKVSTMYCLPPLLVFYYYPFNAKNKYFKTAPYKISNMTFAIIFQFHVSFILCLLMSLIYFPQRALMKQRQYDFV